MKKYFAHSGNDFGSWHLLKEHLESVSKLAHSYSEGWRGGEEAALAGLLHDLGKYGDRFQNRLHGQDQGLDHWSQGAFLALTKYGSIVSAIAIQGHHIGLQSLQKEDLKKLMPGNLAKHHPQHLQLSDLDIELLESRLHQDALAAQKPASRLFSGWLGQSQARIDTMLDVRRVFSALVDADFIDTESHFNGDSNGKIYRKPGLKLNDDGIASAALKKLCDYIDAKSALADQASVLQQVRRQLLNCCLTNAQKSTSIFTLTAPTGSGKTLSMLSFALQHAIHNNLERIILVIPYLSIIEQTAQIYREIFAEFGPDFVLEHHSMSGLGEETAQSDAEGCEDRERQLRRQRLLSENWDAPVVVTTSVQFLESLFSNRPSACRKIHRIANSVILFDEVQTLPTDLAIPTLAALSHIGHSWQSSVVFATATQPAFDHLHAAVQKQCSFGWQPTIIVNEHGSMSNALRRVDYDWLDENPTWTELAAMLNEQTQVLCIVNLKRHTQALWEAFETMDELFHLSTNLCPLHRQQVLNEVRQRLKDDLPCRLIATQCIEAGVDVDFPLVYRAFGPLDAIIQAAGRCNREGKLNKGKTIVFTPDCDGRLYPDKTYEQASSVTASLKHDYGEAFDPYDSKIIEQYYRRLYTVAAPEQLGKRLNEAVQDLNFVDVAKHYRLINNDTINLVVPYDRELYEQLREQAATEGLTSKWVKQARCLSISLYRPKPDDVIWDSLVPVQVFRNGRQGRKEDWFIVNNIEDYDANLGYIKPEHLNLYIA